MPAMRPEAISNCIRLANECGAAPAAFVAERGAVDAVLPFSGALVSAIVNELAPDEEGIAVERAEHDLFARADELPSSAAVSIAVGGIVALIHLQASSIAVARQPPQRRHQPP